MISSVDDTTCERQFFHAAQWDVPENMPINFHHYFVLPCHGLEDFPTHLHGAEAANLLNTWTVLWHPALLAAANRMPINLRVGIDDCVEPEGVVLIPAIATSMLDDTFISMLHQKRMTVVQGTAAQSLPRNELLRLALVGSSELQVMAAAVADDLAADFYSLAYAYLQVETMTRQLRYSSNLNQERFEQKLIEGALAAVANDSEQAKTAIGVCFDLLLQEKNCYYPVEPQLLDLVLVAPQTLGSSLAQQLIRTHPFSLSLTGGTAEKLVQANPALVPQLRERIELGEVAIVGGFQNELPGALLSSETELHQLLRGGQTFADLLNCSVKVFFQQSRGVHSNLPSILEKLDFIGAIHATLDGTGVPLTSDFNIRWESPDGGNLPALGGPLLNAADAGSLLGLGSMIGKQLDSAHNAAILFAHWPNQYCEAFQDLLGCQRYHSLFGRWRTMPEYFDSVYDPGYGNAFEPNEYRFSFLQHGISNELADPISRFQDYWAAQGQVLAWQGLLTQLLFSHALDNQPAGFYPNDVDWVKMTEAVQRLPQLRDQLFSEEHSLNQTRQDIADTIQLLEQSLDASANHDPSIRPSQESLVVFNPFNFKRDFRAVTPPFTFEDQHQRQAIRFFDAANDPAISVIQLAGNSTMTFPLDTLSSQKQSVSGSSKMLEREVLRNEFFEVHVDPGGGGIAGIYSYQQRRSIASQQLAIRIPRTADHGRADTAPREFAREFARQSTKESARYTQMVVERIENHSIDSIEGAITSTGYLKDGEHKLAKFKQTLSMIRGIPLVQIDVEVDLLTELSSDLHHYLCQRIAWRDETAQLSSNFQEMQLPVLAEWFHAPLFYHVGNVRPSLTLLTNGLSFHRRSDRRIVDTPLIVSHESRRRFRLALGVDLDYPVTAAIGWMTPAMVARGRTGELGSEMGSELGSELGDCQNRSTQHLFLHFDRKNILVTGWEPICDENFKLTRLLFRCRETEGRSGELTMTLGCPIQAACRVDFLGNFQQTLQSKEDHQVSVHFHGFEYFQIELQL